jgi:8-oxo-dGTP pyrophosphatase MutT (NUDIX family)
VTEAPLRDAATVMLVRDGRSGVEVLMLQRTHGATFVGGYHVFPGGVVDDSDRSSEIEALSAGLTDGGASASLGLADGGLAFWAAAVRECFEEAGILLAITASGSFVDFADGGVAERFTAYRHAIYEGDLRLVDLCRAEALRLPFDDIRYVSHWITPVGEVRRFDTRFFVARAPAGQEPLHDEGETIATLWVRPEVALDRYRRRELRLLPPTVRNLQFLAGHRSANAVLTAAAEISHPPAIQPRPADLASGNW